MSVLSLVRFIVNIIIPIILSHNKYVGTVFGTVTCCLVIRRLP
jgi:hypothetical protein